MPEMMRGSSPLTLQKWIADLLNHLKILAMLGKLVITYLTFNILLQFHLL